MLSSKLHTAINVVILYGQIVTNVHENNYQYTE